MIDLRKMQDHGWPLWAYSSAVLSLPFSYNVVIITCYPVSLYDAASTVSELRLGEEWKTGYGPKWLLKKKPFKLIIQLSIHTQLNTASAKIKTKLRRRTLFLQQTLEIVFWSIGLKKDITLLRQISMGYCNKQWLLTW